MSDMSAKVRKALDVAVEAIGGSAREGQIEMAEAVANALTNRHHLMVQAGTGTGKSLAYLIPGIVHGRSSQNSITCELVCYSLGGTIHEFMCFIQNHTISLRQDGV